MRLPTEKIKEAILSPDPELRDAAVYYFSQSFSTDPSIMPLVIRAFEQFGPDAFEMTALYGPYDKITTKIVDAVFKYEGAEPVLERWGGPNIKDSSKVRRQIQEFFDRHRVKSVAATGRIWAARTRKDRTSAWAKIVLSVRFGQANKKAGCKLSEELR